jgi:hypothetical protein
LIDDEDDAWTEAVAGAGLLSEGAAADSADDQYKRLEGLPRLLRYALLVQNEFASDTALRLLAEIDAICPDLAQAKTWALVVTEDTGLPLADELDRLAVVRDLPLLRSLGDCVRMLSLTLPCRAECFEAFRRVGRTMLLAFDQVASGLDDQQRFELEQIAYGWAACPVATRFDGAGGSRPAAKSAMDLGRQMVRYRIRAATIDTARRIREDIERQQEAVRPPERSGSSEGDPTSPGAAVEPAALHRVVVGRIDDAAIKTHKFIQPVGKILNTALPLVETPALDQVRNSLAAEFPYAINVIDFALADLIGRPTAHFRPLLLVGDPGAGKSYFGRRLGEVLGLTIWRTDAAQSDGNAFGGTDRRWHSAEPCHPLLAIARGGNANPMILIDELEKAGTRSDYGRLWDCLLGLLEPETSARYPDPALQITLDLSHASYVATANTLDPIPSPLRDRFRIVSFPKPSRADLDILLPALLRSFAGDRQLDDRWIAPVGPDERVVIAEAWRGGSVRRLRRILEAILRTRDQSARRH